MRRGKQAFGENGVVYFGGPDDQKEKGVMIHGGPSFFSRVCARCGAPFVQSKKRPAKLQKYSSVVKAVVIAVIAVVKAE